jgi:hypothetical protein
MASRLCQIFLASTTKAQEVLTVSTYCTDLPGFSPAVSPNPICKFYNFREFGCFSRTRPPLQSKKNGTLEAGFYMMLSSRQNSTFAFVVQC